MLAVNHAKIFNRELDIEMTEEHDAKVYLYFTEALKDAASVLAPSNYNIGNNFYRLSLILNNSNYSTLKELDRFLDANRLSITNADIRSNPAGKTLVRMILASEPKLHNNKIDRIVTKLSSISGAKQKNIYFENILKKDTMTFIPLV